MPSKQPGMLRHSFARPDADILLYDAASNPMPPAWPAMQLLEVDAEVRRLHGGVAIAEGHAHYRLSLDASPQAAGFARVTDLRTRQVTDYDIVQTDDRPSDWTAMLTLVQRQAAIGIR